MTATQSTRRSEVFEVKPMIIVTSMVHAAAMTRSAASYRLGSPTAGHRTSWIGGTGANDDDALRFLGI